MSAAILEIFEPLTCCFPAQRGPERARQRDDFAASLADLRDQGFTIKHYDPTSHYDVYLHHATVVAAVRDHGTTVLPLIMLDGEIIHRSGYPSRVELTALLRAKTLAGT